MSEQAMNPAMLVYYNRNDKLANDLPIYSYRRVLEEAEKNPYVPVPLYFPTNELRLAMPEVFKSYVSLQGDVKFTTDVNAAADPRLSTPRYSKETWDKVTVRLRRKVQETGELADLLEKVEQRLPLKAYVIVFEAGKLAERYLHAAPNAIYDLPDGRKNWALFLHDVYRSGIKHDFLVDWEQASLPDEKGEVSYRILTPEEAPGLDRAWRESLRRDGFRLFLKEMQELAVTEEEKQMVKAIKAKVEMLQLY